MDGFRPADDDHPADDHVAADRADVAGGLADAQVRPLDGVGHFVPLEAPAAFAAAVLERAAPRS